MLTAGGCRQRRQRFWHRLQQNHREVLAGGHVLLGDPIHLMYLVNFWVDPFSLGGGFGGLLLLRPD